MNKELRRNEREGMIGGVCAGLGEYMDLDKIWIRLFFVLSIFFSFFGVGILGPFIYLLMWIIVPAKPFVFPGFSSGPYGSTKQEMHTNEPSLNDDFYKRVKKARDHDRKTAGLLLLCIGFVLLVIQLGFVSWTLLFKFWPIVFVLAGIYVVYSSFSHSPFRKKEKPEETIGTDVNENTEDINIED